MRNILAMVAMAAGILLGVSDTTNASSLVLASQQLTVDSDGDATPDLFDNAPGTANNQADADADGIGDIIDPTPNASNPNLGDPGFILAPAMPIVAGANANFDYLVLVTPPGGWGRIELDFDQDNVADAVFFGPLTAVMDTISIPAGLFVDPLWDLYTPGTYTVAMKAYAPGMSSANWAHPYVTVLPVPEPSTLLLATLAYIVTMFGWTRRASPCREFHR